MKIRFSLLLVISGFLLLSVFFVSRSLTLRTDNEVVTFINSLDEDQRSKVMMDFNSLGKDRWHFLPSDSWFRSGINFKSLNENQRLLVHKMLKSYLSQAGYEKVKTIIELENILAELENNPVKRDPELYFVSIFGNPKQDAVWSWRFEGHHISLHFTVVDDEVAFTPRFFGANPAIVKSGVHEGKKTVYTEQELGLNLIKTFDEDQLEQAVISDVAYFDIATMNASEVGPFENKGIALNKLNHAQQMILFGIIKEYLSSIPSEIGSMRLAKLEKEEAGDIYFGWAGARELGKAHYYRIQGKSFLLEFDNAQNGANHIHTVWREFEGDFGRDLIREHRLEHTH